MGLRGTGLQLVVALGVSAGACGHADRGPPAVEAALPEGVAAEIGGEKVSTALVGAIASRQGVDAKTARERAISDAAFAAFARERFDVLGWPEAAERASLARALLATFRDEARAKGPPTDAEIESVTADRWQEIQRPALSRTEHAVVLVKSPSDDAKAKQVAGDLAAALRGVSDPKEFERIAKSIDARGLEVRVEKLLPVAADGRVADPAQQPGNEPSRFDLDFARAATAIPNVGDQSPVVHSAFGYHVILLTERIPEAMLSLEQRRSLLAREIMDRRARALLEAEVTRASSATPVVVDRAADDLMARIQVPR